MQAANFEEALENILKADSRYHRHAYVFVREALDHTQKAAAKGGKLKAKHVKGQELLHGIRAYGLDQFGPMTLTVFAEWGIHRCEDFGEIVFNMVEHHLLAKTQEDSRDDFKGGYDFAEAFYEPYVPSHKRKSPRTEINPAQG